MSLSVKRTKQELAVAQQAYRSAIRRKRVSIARLSDYLDEYCRYSACLNLSIAGFKRWLLDYAEGRV